ncbi:MAG: cystathionine beta-lyase [Actinobacteria bacterium HGW-Actinobacteria-4]|nr:MAG: cystathionine beta-lyase [Actinobacteria bacterium HGW-Actinobacteria-4]
MPGSVPSPARHNPLTDLTLAQLRERTSAKWQRYAPDVLPLFVAEMDTPLAPPIEEALARAVHSGDMGYPEGHAYEEALAQFAANRWDWPGISPDHMAGVADVISGYVSALALFTEPGDHVVVNPPVYPPFYSAVSASGRIVTEAPLGAHGRLDFDTIEEALARAAAAGKRVALLLCSPHNPTGAVHTRRELEHVAQLAHQYNAGVVVDEIHAPLVFAPHTFVPYLTVDGGDTGISLMAASKAWNLAGLKGALMIAGTGASSALERFRTIPHHGPSHLGAMAQTAAYRDGGAWLDELMAGLDNNRALLARLLSEQLPDVHCREPEATYLAWLDCSDLELPGEDPAAYFLEHARVALNSGPTFGTGGAGHVRLNFATHPDILTEAIRRLAASTSAE